MRYLHTMVRVTDLDASPRFYRDAFALEVTRRGDVTAGRFTLGYLAPSGQPESEIDDSYIACERLLAHGGTLNRPPRDGRMAFVRSRDGISIESLQAGSALAPAQPWASMPNMGAW